MKALNLTANGKSQERILAYLKENVSDVLADKINNGVYIEKDGKRLLNKKTLDGFMKYANGEARKLVEKGSDAACIDDPVVFGWAVHYFEEDSIEGKLYNADGSEYKPVINTKNTQKPSYTATSTVKKKENEQPSLFDLMNDEKVEKVTEEPEIEEVEAEEPKVEEQQTELDIDIETGEVLNSTDEDKELLSAFDKNVLYSLMDLFGDDLTIE